MDTYALWGNMAQANGTMNSKLGKKSGVWVLKHQSNIQNFSCWHISQHKNLLSDVTHKHPTAAVWKGAWNHVARLNAGRFSKRSMIRGKTAIKTESIEKKCLVTYHEIPILSRFCKLDYLLIPGAHITILDRTTWLIPTTAATWRRGMKFKDKYKQKITHDFNNLQHYYLWLTNLIAISIIYIISI